MPTTYAIPDGRTVMAATTYTGTGANASISNAVNGVSMQPDLVWVKNRGSAIGHILVDAVRGANNVLRSNEATAEAGTGTYGNTITGFNSNGFSLGNDAVIPNGVNGSANTYVGWQWNAGGSTVTNTNGSISAQVRASTTAGFSIITYTGNGTTGATVGHGLGAAPKFLIWKPRASATDWMVWHTGLSGFNYDVRLNTTAAQGTGANPLNNTAPTSTVITLRNQGDVNGSGTTIVCYAFAAVAGYSAFGSYTGNASTDGPFVYLGFKPRFLMLKRTDVANAWMIYDLVRNTSNVVNRYLFANAADAENTGSGSTDQIDFLSNGFKVRCSNNANNASGGTYIYACFAENPFKFANAE